MSGIGSSSSAAAASVGRMSLSHCSSILAPQSAEYVLLRDPSRTTRSSSPPVTTRRSIRARSGCATTSSPTALCPKPLASSSRQAIRRSKRSCNVALTVR